MAEITAPAAAGPQPGGRRGKKLSTRVDLTPMVDLGFLLITFFIFTTTMSKPSAMQLIMPADSRDETPVQQSHSLTVIPGRGNKVFYYHGLLEEAIPRGLYGVVGYANAAGIGQVIRNKQAVMARGETSQNKKMMLIIKPLNTANYKNVVDILDEVKINDVKFYALSNISNEEIMALLKKDFY